jgi:hypothetical protein
LKQEVLKDGKAPLQSESLNFAMILMKKVSSIRNKELLSLLRLLSFANREEKR